MVKVDFKRAGVDSGWTVTGKYAKDNSTALIPSDSRGTTLRLEDPITSVYTVTVRGPSCYTHDHPRVLQYRQATGKANACLVRPPNPRTSIVSCPTPRTSIVSCPTPRTSIVSSSTPRTSIVYSKTLRLANTNQIIRQDHFDSLAVHASVSKTNTKQMRCDAPDVNELPQQTEGTHGRDSAPVEQGSTSDISTVLMKKEKQDDQLVEDAEKPREEQPIQAQTDEQNPTDSSTQRSRTWSCFQVLDGFSDIVSFHPPKQKKPSVAEARERLQRVIDLHNMKKLPVLGDGNCQFRALSLQLNGTENNHAHVRACIVEHLEKEPDRYKDFVHEKYSDYLKRMAKNEEWGDHVTLQAASEVYGKDIRILTDQPGAECVYVRPQMTSNVAQKPLCLTFLTEKHYDVAESLV